MPSRLLIGLFFFGIVLSLFSDQIASHLLMLGGRLVVIWLPVVFMLVLFAVVVVRSRALNRELIEGGARLAGGRTFDALSSYEKARKIAPRNAAVQANLGIASLYLWRVGESVALLREAAANKGQVGLQDLRPLTRPYLAFATAISGQVGDARVALKELGGTLSANSPHALLAECVLACREGNWARAEELVRRPEVYQLGGFFRAVSEVLEAWAVFNLRGENRRFNRVALYSEAGPDGLRKVWPELAEFAEKSG